jgi:hypothetical protein
MSSASPVTDSEIRQAEREHRNALARVEAKRAARDEIIRQAIAEKWTHQRIMEATVIDGRGLSRGRINQIAHEAGS